MFQQKSRKGFKFNGFKAVLVGFSSVAMAMSLSACGAVDVVKSIHQEDAFPPMPNPEVATYVVDLSGSTFPTAQLDALESGVADFIAGQSLGNPFAESPVAPRGLSIQFVTKNSAQAPRILLVSTSASQELYQFVKENSPNAEVAKRLWKGFMQARTEIWQNRAFEANTTECVKTVIKSLGSQQLLPDALRAPANLICQSAKQTAIGSQRLESFVKSPGIEMGSDVEGAIKSSLMNLDAVKGEFPNARVTLVIASDFVDEEELNLRKRLNGIDASAVCKIATQDAGNASANYSSVNVVIVGARNSKVNKKILDQVQSYWTCYFNQLGITNINEQSDLSGF